MAGAQDVSYYVLDAVDESDARRQVVTAGLAFISIARERSLKFGGRNTRLQLVTFSQELVALLDAGLSLVESIETLGEKEASPTARRTLAQVMTRLREGQTLGTALSEHPQTFPTLYVATVRAAERTGALREALSRYIAYQQQVDVLRKSLINASIYPAVLCGAGLLVVAFLMGYVVPRFSSIYEDLGSNLPFASRMLMRWGQFLDAHGLGVALGAAGVIAGLVYAIHAPGGKGGHRRAGGADSRTRQPTAYLPAGATLSDGRHAATGRHPHGYRDADVRETVIGESPAGLCQCHAGGSRRPLAG